MRTLTFCASTLSPTWMVGSIEPVGTVNGATMNTRTSAKTANAIRKTPTHSASDENDSRTRVMRDHPHRHHGSAR